MRSFEEMTDVLKVPNNNQTSSEKTDIFKDGMFQIMEENFAHFKVMQNTPNGYLGKLAFISSILRAHNLQRLSVEQDFENAFLGNIEQKFICTILAEPYLSDQNKYKKATLARVEQLKLELQENQDVESFGTVPTFEFLGTPNIFQQKSRIKKLFEKILVQVNHDDDAALALTSFFVFELDSLNTRNSKDFLTFFDLYDLGNPLDKWFASIDIQAVVKKPLFFINSSSLFQ